MHVETYSDLALRTAKRFDDPKMTYLHGYLGVFGELGEICDALKRHHIYGRPLDLINLGEEIGDLTWYANYMLRELPEVFDDVVVGDGTRVRKDRKRVIATLFQDMPALVAAGLAERGVAAPKLGAYELISGAGRVLLELPPPAGYEDSKDCADRIETGVISAIALAFGLCEVYGLDYAGLLAKNIYKLQVRYPDLFDSDRAVHRDEQAERKALE